MESAKAKKPKLSAFIVDAQKVAELCVKLSDEKSSHGSKDSLKRLSPKLYQHLTSCQPIMLPTTRNMTLTLPSKEVMADQKGGGGSGPVSGGGGYNPFRELVYINGVEDEVSLLFANFCKFLAKSAIDESNFGTDNV